MIDKYSKFINESFIIDEMLLEANMVYSNSFKNLISKIADNSSKTSDIAKLIIDKEKTFVDINDNYLDTSNNPHTIKFIPDNKVSDDIIYYKSTMHLHTIEVSRLVRSLSFNLDNVLEDYDRDYLVNKIWKIIDSDTHSNYSELIFYLIEEVNENDSQIKRLIVYHNKENNGFEVFITKVKSTEVRLGRFLNRFLKSVNYNFIEKDIEDFSNEYQAYFNIEQRIFDNFKVVKGEEIRYWYNCKNYASEIGELGKSCMRYEHCSPFFDIYCKNEKTCSLLILTDDNNKLIGRALLWKMVQGYNYIDRIYTSKESYTNIFHKWADINNYKMDTNKLDTVSVNKEWYNYYPFMDTFSFFSPKEGILTTHFTSKLKGLLELSDTEGHSEEY